MENQFNDTVNLLKKCNTGSKMAVSSIDEILDKAENPKLIVELVECKDRHSKLGNRMHSLLRDYEQEDKDIPVVAKAMAWMTSNMKLMSADHDKAIAGIMIDGSNMGIKSLSSDLNSYKDADDKAVNICKDLIDIEDNFAEKMRNFL